jgi:serine/threonine protein kinase
VPLGPSGRARSWASTNSPPSSAKAGWASSTRDAPGDRQAGGDQGAGAARRAVPGSDSRFKQEAHAVNKIRHPNIIDIFAFNQLPVGRDYFVMEYLDGESLTTRLERGSMEFAEMRMLPEQHAQARRSG